jgi:putative transposase
LLGFTPQAYHKHQNKTLQLHLQQGLVLNQVHRIRKLQPRCGGRKLFIELSPFFKEHNIKMGRDAFFDLLRRNRMLVRKLKRNVYTTMSKHHFRKYPNLAKEFTPIKAHELWVADITYIPTKHRHAYLFLITDAYSRKIVGFHLSYDMKVSSGIIALKKALAQKPADAIVIHHSDRGIQYCSTEYTNMLLKNNCMISMTQNRDPYENDIAERVNGI